MAAPAPSVLVVDISRATIDRLVEERAEGRWSMDVRGWENLLGRVREEEVALIQLCCALQRYIENKEKQGAVCQEVVDWYIDVVTSVSGYQVEIERAVDNLSAAENLARRRAMSAHVTLQKKVRDLLVCTQFREDIQRWIWVAYFRKELRRQELSQAERAVRASFDFGDEYTLGRVEEGMSMSSWLQLHNLAVDQTSAIRLAMAASSSLFPSEW